MKKVSNNILSRVYILFGLFLFFGLLIVLRIMGLQLNKGTYISKELEEQVFFKRLVADRGNITAEDGTIMATSLPFYRIAMDPSIVDTTSWLGFNDSLMVLAGNLAHHFDHVANDSINDTLRHFLRIREAMLKGDRHLYLTRKKINFKELEMVKSWPILRRGRYEGGMVVEKFNNERFYPLEDLARITLGRLVDDTLGIRGIEHAFNQELRGRDGYILAQKVVGDSYVPLDQYGEEASLDGYDITTTLDVDLQDVVENALKYGVEANFAKYGTAILMEVETGKIKALANYPETYNHAVATRIEPGSTFKLASAAALFEDNLVQPCDTFDTGDGTVMYDDKEITDNGKAYGKIEFEKIIAFSSNVGVSTIVNQFYGEHPDHFIQHLKNFGFSEPVNQQLVGEPRPKLIGPESEEWTIATLPSMSFGYSIGVTPLQMATFYNGVANGGRLMRPWLVKEIRDNSKLVKRYKPEVINPQMISSHTAMQLREVMKGVVQYGTAARQFRKMPFEVAGKTGTVRKIQNGRYVRRYRASFGGFFPANNPRYSLYIMIDEPDGGTASGGKVAGPVFRRIAEQIYTMDMKLSRPPAKTEEEKKRKVRSGVIYVANAKRTYQNLGMKTGNVPQSDWVSVKVDSQQVRFEALDLSDNKVPDLRGMSGRDAINLLEKMGITVTLKGVGRVRRQSLLPGYRVGKDASITLFLG